MKRNLVMGILSALALLCALPSSAASAEDGMVMKQMSPTSLQISTEVEFGTATLRVAGPEGYSVEKILQRGFKVDFSLFDGGDDPVDGSYRWAMTYASPVDPQLADSISKARETGDTRFVEGLKASGLFTSGTWDGSFLVVDGAMIVPGGLEEAAFSPNGDSDSKDLPAKDQVILDDLIVDGSACIGFDCVNGEDFGFDTIRLKENNLRIKFEDTSGGNFPSNDWQITANDSGNGGANKFSIDDISNGRTPFTIEARAPSHSLFVDDGGRLGLGTSLPVVDLHVVSGNSPTLRLEQNGSSGFQPQTWDLAGNETSFFIRDASNGSTLPFRIRPSAGTNVLVIDSDSQVGVGLLSPTHKLHVKENGSSGDLRIAAKLENNGPVSLQLLDSASGDDWVFSNKPNGFEVSKGGTGQIEMRLDAAGSLFIQGGLTTAMDVYPDYVFDAGYELMPLDQLATFIETNGHLPNVKTEDEVEMGRQVNLSELSRSLLEKVEELTLYTLEQHETDGQLRSALKQQNEVIRQLEARLAALEDGH